MFTGIVATVGRIEKIDPLNANAQTIEQTTEQSGVRLTLEAAALDLDDVHLGDSIAINGACMTVVAKHGSTFQVDVSQESLRCTVGLNQPGNVNLEKALRLSDRLGGHLMAGHVDGLGTVTTFEALGESWILEILVPDTLAKYFAYKGSVVVNGVSLTINQVKDLVGNSVRNSVRSPENAAPKNPALEPEDVAGCKISINVIPHTLQNTTLHALTVGSQVNLEVDLIARYVDRLLEKR